MSLRGKSFFYKLPYKGGWIIYFGESFSVSLDMGNNFWKIAFYLWSEEIIAIGYNLVSFLHNFMEDVSVLTKCNVLFNNQYESKIIRVIQMKKKRINFLFIAVIYFPLSIQMNLLLLTLYNNCYVILTTYILDSAQEPTYNLSKNLLLLPLILKLIVYNMLNDSNPCDYFKALNSQKEICFLKG